MPHGLTAKLRLKPPSETPAPLNCGEGRDASAPSGLRRTFGARPLRGRLGYEHDVGTGPGIGVLRLEYPHRTSLQGGLDDAQHRRHYPRLSAITSPSRSGASTVCM